MIDQHHAEEFLALPTIAVLGASDDARNFGRTVYVELRDHGRHVVAVHPTADTVAGDPCYPTLAAVPGTIDGVVVMVGADQATQVVRDAAALGIHHLWLFRGIGGHGAVSEEALEACRAAGIEVVAGACPLMFLTPVGWFHRAHRGVRRLRGAVGTAA
jgi:predicted CoA-binding protein